MSGSPAPHTPQILGVRTVDGSPTYMLHWKGWAKKWEEWVRPDRMMELTAENVELMKRVNAEAKAAESARSSSAAPGSTTKSAKSPKGGGRGSKSAGAGGEGKSSASSSSRAVAAAQEHETLPVSVALPFALRKLLVDDWEFVTKRACLVRIPKRPAGTAPVLPAPLASPAASAAPAEAHADFSTQRGAKRARRADSPASSDAASGGAATGSSSAAGSSPTAVAGCPVPTLTVDDILHEFLKASAARGADADRRGDEEVVEGKLKQPRAWVAVHRQRLLAVCVCGLPFGGCPAIAVAWAHRGQHARSSTTGVLQPHNCLL